MLMFIEILLVLKALERSDTFRPSNSLSHKQNGKQIYYETRTVFLQNAQDSSHRGSERPDALKQMIMKRQFVAKTATTTTERRLRSHRFSATGNRFLKKSYPDSKKGGGGRG